MICRIILLGFGLAYLLALLIYFSGEYGWFGQQIDPLSGIFLIPLGLPWNLIEAPRSIMPALGAGAPFINFLIIFLLCRVVKSGDKKG